MARKFKKNWRKVDIKRRSHRQTRSERKNKQNVAWAKSFVTNLSDYNLSETQICLLAINISHSAKWASKCSLNSLLSPIEGTETSLNSWKCGNNATGRWNMVGYLTWLTMSFVANIKGRSLPGTGGFIVTFYTFWQSESTFCSWQDLSASWRPLGSHHVGYTK